jgi:predicted metal-dependent enzyme (double-stranded beta helix superfamily)
VTASTLGADVPARTATRISSLASSVSFDRLPDRDLDDLELRALAASIAADQSLWGGDVDISDGRRHYRSVYRDEHVDVWLLAWAPGSDTGWHDHDVSSGAVAVARGRLIEHNPALFRPEVSTHVDAGAVFAFGPDHIHRLTPVEGDDQGAVSVHVYSPPLQRLGQYHVDDFGVLRREVITYEDELRSFEDVA